MVAVTKVSELTGQTHTMWIDGVTVEQLEEYAKGGKHIQDVFPHLSAEEREFIMTGITPDEWDAVFGGDDE